MKTLSINVQKTFNLGSFQSMRLGGEWELEDGDTFENSVRLVATAIQRMYDIMQEKTVSAPAETKTAEVKAEVTGTPKVQTPRKPAAAKQAAAKQETPQVPVIPPAMQEEDPKEPANTQPQVPQMPPTPAAQQQVIDDKYRPQEGKIHLTFGSTEMQQLCNRIGKNGKKNPDAGKPYPEFLKDGKTPNPKAGQTVPETFRILDMKDIEEKYTFDNKNVEASIMAALMLNNSKEDIKKQPQKQ